MIHGAIEGPEGIKRDIGNWYRVLSRSQFFQLCVEALGAEALKVALHDEIAGQMAG